MKQYLYISLLLFYISANAQIKIVTYFPEIDTLYLPKLTGDSFYENKLYFGEQYYNTEWVKGDILLSTGEILHDKLLKYNGLFDELIWLNTNNYRQFKLDKDIISEFWLKGIKDSTIHFKQINVSNPINSQQQTYVEVCVEGVTSLYIQRKIRTLGSQSIFKDNVLKVYTDLYNTPIYYIKTSTNSFIILSKISQKQFTDLFPQNKKYILKLLKENHLQVKTEKDIIKIIELINKSKIL